MSKYLFIILVFSCFISSCLKNDEDLSLKKKLKILEEYYKQTGDIDEKTNFNCHDFLRFHQNSFIPERSSKKNFSTILTHYQYKSQKNNNIEGINIASFLLSENYFSKKILSIINSNPNEINLSLKEILPELLILFESKAPLQHKNSILNKEHIKNIISNAYDQLQTTKQREALLEIISKTYKDFFKKYSKIPLKEWLRQDVFFPLKNKDVFISKNGLKIKNFIEKYSYAESLLHDSELISKCLAIKIKEYKHYNHENKCSKHNFLLESLILHQVNLQNKENIKNINQIFRENNEKTDCTSIPNKIWVKFSHKDDNIETKKYIFHHYNILFVDSFYKEERKWNRNLNSFFEKCLRHNIPIEISKKMKTIAPLKIMLNTDIDLKIGVAEYLPEFKSIVLFKNGNTCTSFIHEIFHHLDYELKIKDQWAKLLRYANFITKNPLSLEKKETLSLYFGKDFPRNYSKTHIIEDIATSLEHAIFYPWELQRISPARFKLVQKIFNFKISPQKI